MKTFLYVSALACAMCWSGAVAHAKDPAPTKQQLQGAAQRAGSVNGLCPIRSRLVTTEGGAMTYGGERVAFCCKGCAAKFQAEPARYMDLMRLNPPKYWYISRFPSVVAMRKAKRQAGAANGRCPVMGKTVVQGGGSSTHKGQRIQFCCPPCKAKFEANPARYMRLMQKDPLAYAYDRPGPTALQLRTARASAGTVNGRCPVMGKLVTKSGGFVTYRGQRIGFCCPPCVAKFRKDPERFLTAMRREPWTFGYLASGN